MDVLAEYAATERPTAGRGLPPGVKVDPKAAGWWGS